MLHVYCGKGKGKTTAAVGLTVRFSGAGGKCAFVQFLKNGSSSEIAPLRSLPGVTVACAEKCDKFAFEMNDEEKAALTASHNALLAEAERLVKEGAGLLVLDEFNAAYGHGLLDREAAERLVLDNKDACEIVLTGRSPAGVFLDAADYISEITPIRHPFGKGVAARKGVEY